MNAAVQQPEPWTLTKSSDGTILSFRHRALAASHLAVMKQLEAHELEIVPRSDDVMPSLRTCLECGCTDQFQCEGGCTWAKTLLCSRCAVRLFQGFRCREDVEASIEWCDNKADTDSSLALMGLARIQCELLLDIRELLATPLPDVDPRLEILERIAERAESRLVVPSEIVS